MKHPLLLFALLLAGQFCLVACRKNDGPRACKPMTDELIYPQDSVVAVSAKLKRDCLKLTVDYRGGCADHKFALYWSGGVCESLPPQTAVQLLHDNGGDTCDEIQTVELSYDLDRFGMPDNDLIIVTLDAAGVETQRFNYPI